MAERVVVIGAGVVGLCAGLALAEAGREVLLVGRDLPGGGASRWNAGVLSTSSLAPGNEPGLAARLPGMLLGRSPGFRLGPRAAALRALTWGPRFLRAGRPATYVATVEALDGLIRLSMAEHRRLLREAGAADLLTDAGWLMLYETEAQFEGAAPLRATLEGRGVAFEVRDAAGLAELEPHLARRFVKAMWLTGSAAAIEPRLVLEAYLARFRSLGGVAERGDVVGLERGGARPAVVLADGRREEADHVVVAAGIWSAGLLAGLGVKLPMMAERGYVRRFALAPGAGLGRPVFDVGGGLVLSPRPEGVQLSTGTELTLPGLPGLDVQREPAARRAAEVLPLGAALAGSDAEADRPTLPDCRPAIGRLKGPGSIWLCCGHQHIGFSTSAGSGALLAALMRGAPPPAPPGPFSPARFGL